MKNRVIDQIRSTLIQVRIDKALQIIIIWVVYLA